MRILHVYRTYLPETRGGLELAINQVCKATTRLGVENRIFTLSSNPRASSLQAPEATVFRTPRSFEVASCGFSLQGIFSFRQHLQWADIVHYHYPWPFGDMLHLLHSVKLPTLLTYHADIVRQERLSMLYGPLREWFLKKADAIIATSPAYLDTSRVLNRYRAKITTIPIGLDPASYPEVDPRRVADWRGRLGDDFFLFVGVMRYYKGLHVLLEALRGSTSRVVLVGQGPAEHDLRRQARTLGLRNVQFLGFLPEEDKVALLSLCMGMVFPSHLRAEAFGLSLLEAAMHAKPMISAEIGTGTSYINVDGVTGLVVPREDPAALRAAIDLLASKPELCERMGREARQRFDSLFTAEEMGSKHLGLYQRLLARGHGDERIGDEALRRR